MNLEGSHSPPPVETSSSVFFTPESTPPPGTVPAERRFSSCPPAASTASSVLALSPPALSPIFQQVVYGRILNSSPLWHLPGGALPNGGAFASYPLSTRSFRQLPSLSPGNLSPGKQAGTPDSQDQDLERASAASPHSEDLEAGTREALEAGAREDLEASARSVARVMWPLHDPELDLIQPVEEERSVPRRDSHPLDPNYEVDRAGLGTPPALEEQESLYDKCCSLFWKKQQVARAPSPPAKSNTSIGSYTQAFGRRIAGGALRLFGFANAEDPQPKREGMRRLFEANSTIAQAWLNTIDDVPEIADAYLKQTFFAGRWTALGVCAANNLTCTESVTDRLGLDLILMELVLKGQEMCSQSLSSSKLEKFSSCLLKSVSLMTSEQSLSVQDNPQLDEDQKAIALLQMNEKLKKYLEQQGSGCFKQRVENVLRLMVEKEIQEKNALEVFVKDHGSGIKPENRKNFLNDCISCVPGILTDFYFQKNLMILKALGVDCSRLDPVFPIAEQNFLQTMFKNLKGFVAFRELSAHFGNSVEHLENEKQRILKSVLEAGVDSDASAKEFREAQIRETKELLREHLEKTLEESVEKSIKDYFSPPVLVPEFLNEALESFCLKIANFGLRAFRYFFNTEAYAANRMLKLLEHPENFNFCLRIFLKLTEEAQELELPAESPSPVELASPAKSDEELEDSVQSVDEEAEILERSRIDQHNQATSASFALAAQEIVKYLLPPKVFRMLSFLGYDVHAMTKTYVLQELSKTYGVVEDPNALKKEDCVQLIMENAQREIDLALRKEIIKFRALKGFEHLKEVQSQKAYEILQKGLDHLVSAYFDKIASKEGKEHMAIYNDLASKQPKEIFAKLVDGAYA